MAVKGRMWSNVDVAVAEFANAVRDQSGDVSLRTMAEQIGMSYSRFRDILNQLNGTPTLVEFLSLCQYADVDPAVQLQEVIERADELENVGVSDMSDDAAVDLELVAHRDSNKYKEMEDYYD